MKLLNELIGIPQTEDDIEPGFQSLAELPFVIIIGLTGVGKSTTLDLLPKNGLEFTLLPNRRVIADQIIIAALQREDGESFYPVLDRVKRFEYTARYRAKYAGGMAHALSRLYINSSHAQPTLIFDGLRGLDEVQHAVSYFPQAKFVVLDAPDMVRLTRLLKRGDAFDNTAIRDSLASQNLIASFMSIPNIDAVFDEDQLRQIARMSRAAEISEDEVLKKVTIIVEERRNYDPDTARVFLTRSQKSNPVLVVDTTRHGVAEVAQMIAEWLRPAPQTEAQ